MKLHSKSCVTYTNVVLIVQELNKRHGGVEKGRPQVWLFHKVVQQRMTKILKASKVVPFSY